MGSHYLDLTDSLDRAENAEQLKQGKKYEFNFFFASLRKLKNMNFIFCRLKKLKKDDFHFLQA